MVHCNTIVHGKINDLLGSPEGESPIAFQVGGSNPEVLFKATQLISKYNFYEINLNLGCPSPKVQSGNFGASLMYDSSLVLDCINAMKDGIGNKVTQVTAKMRLGVDNQRIEETLPQFIESISVSGVQRIIIHARIAMLKSLNPKENRSIPPLDYNIVYQMKQKFSNLSIIVNGGLKTLDDCLKKLLWADGVMMGRSAYNSISQLNDVDSKIFGATQKPKSIYDSLQLYRPYFESQLEKGIPFSSISKHFMGVVNGVEGARKFRQTLSENMTNKLAGWDIVIKAISKTKLKELSENDNA